MAPPVCQAIHTETDEFYLMYYLCFLIEVPRLQVCQSGIILNFESQVLQIPALSYLLERHTEGSF